MSLNLAAVELSRGHTFHSTKLKSDGFIHLFAELKNSSHFIFVFTQGFKMHILFCSLELYRCMVPRHKFKEKDIVGLEEAAFCQLTENYREVCTQSVVVRRYQKRALKSSLQVMKPGLVGEWTMARTMLLWPRDSRFFLSAVLESQQQRLMVRSSGSST